MAPDDRTERPIPPGQAIRIASVVIVVAVLGLWAIANNNDVEVDWLIATTDAPLVVVILLSAAAGFLVGMLAGWRSR